MISTSEFRGHRARDKEAVRSTLRPNHRSCQGSFASFKNGFAQQYESYLERRFLEACEVNPRVTRYQTQSLQVSYYARGKEHFAIPDVRIWTQTSAYVVDVKPEKELAKEKVRIKLREVQAAVQKLGYAYRVVSETEIDAQPVRDAVKELHYWLWHPLPEACVEALDALAAQSHQFSLQMLIQKLQSSGQSEPESHALILLAQGYLSFDLSCGLSPSLLLEAKG